MATEVGLLPNGCMLFVEDNAAGGRTYYSDEIGGGVVVWDTCLVASSTLLAAIVAEDIASYKEAYNNKRKEKNA